MKLFHWRACALILSSLLPGSAVASSDQQPFSHARWIAPPAVADPLVSLPLFRKEFVLQAQPKQAVLRIVGLGDYDARVNGKRLSGTGINQPWSQYEKSIYYRDFDVTGMLRRGANCIGVMMANSFWHNPNPPKGRYNKDGPQRAAQEPLMLIAELRITNTDGASIKVGTEPDWKTAPGPIAFSHIYAGEDFDARALPSGWDKPGFDDGGWKNSRIVEAPGSAIIPQQWPAVSEMRRFEPACWKRPADGVLLASFPQNCAAQLYVEMEGGKAGDRVEFRCGEHKNDKDRLFGAYVVGCNIVTDGKPLAHQWLSFYLGMQFVEITGAVSKGMPNPRNLPVIRKMELVEVRTGLPEAGTFATSSDVLNGTHRIVDWAMRANTSYVLTDCPHREKLGWLECAYLLAPTFEYRYDCSRWFEKILRDLRDAQEPSGRVLTVAPSYPAGRFPGAFNWTVEWGAAAVLLPWEHYIWNGKPEVLRDNFEMMRRFTDYIGREAKDGLAPAGLGDWYDYGHGQPPGPSRFTPVQLSATATWAMCALTVSRAADVLGLADDANSYRELHRRITGDFQRHYRDASGRLKHSGSPQCANAMALCAEVVPAADRPALVREIVEDLQKRDWQQTPGDIGHVYLIRALAEAGRSDVLHRVYAREGKGSYGGVMKKGLTSMPETWDAMVDGYQSLNHCMLGHVMEWFYGYVGGIRQQPGTVGWKDVLIAPCPGPLTKADVSVVTPRGKVSSAWRVENGSFVLNAEVPKGVQAKVILPSGETRDMKAGRHTFRCKMPAS